MIKIWLFIQYRAAKSKFTKPGVLNRKTRSRPGNSYLKSEENPGDFY